MNCMQLHANAQLSLYVLAVAVTDVVHHQLPLQHLLDARGLVNCPFDFWPHR
jgi:hypothetical protein